MQRFITTALIAAVGATVARGQDESFRFFFDKKGTDAEQGARPAGNLSFENPTIVNSGRLYLYIEYGMQDAASNHQDFAGINLEVRVVGPGWMTGGTMFNHKSTPGLDRWGWITRRNVMPGTIWRWGDVFKVGSAGFGAKNIASQGTGDPGVEDTHFSRDDGSPFGTTLLAYVDFASTGPGTAGIFLANGGSGNAGVTITASDFLYFGFGDAAVPNKKGATAGGPGGPSELADAYIIPEPATAAAAALLASIAAVKGARRRA